jgi:putative restriction endonuclease
MILPRFICFCCVYMTTNWDSPFFKVLAHNDTGQAPGHQAGIYLPTGLRKYFPGLPQTVSSNKPTHSEYLNAELLVDGILVDFVTTRYQIQTWAATRTPESRITDQLGELRNQAKAGDILLFRRSLSDLSLYQMELITPNNPRHPQILKQIGSHRSGILDPSTPPASHDDIENELQSQQQRQQGSFSAIDKNLRRSETTVERASRTSAFRIEVLQQYNYCCAFCRLSAHGFPASSIIEGAHVIPRAIGGVDDVRNGLALCRNHHWAFDRHLLTVDHSLQIELTPRAPSTNTAGWLTSLQGRSVMSPNDKRLCLHSEVIDWHRTRALGQ